MGNKGMPVRRLASGVGVLALALAGVIGGAGMASATTDGPGQPGSPTTGSLVIHKYAGSETDQANNGTEQDISRPPLGGVTFEVTPVGKDTGSGCVALDLATASGWTDAQAAIGSTPPASPYCLVTADTMSDVTGADGVVEFDDLPLRLYYVDETDAPEGVDPSISHYVTIPYASEDGDSTDWLYTVHTYPKNDLSGEGDKTVADPSAHGLGSTIPWTIRSKPIGSFDGGAAITEFALIDRLDPKLTYTSTPAPKVTYTVPGGSPADVTSVAFDEPVGAGGTLTATFTDMDWLNSLPAGTYFEFSFSTTVTGVGDIENEGFQNSGGDDLTLGEASTQWGPAKILKHQKGDKSKTLAGAKFSVFDSPNGADCTGTLGDAIAVNGETEFSTGADGVALIEGLWVGNDDQVPSRVYCVVETHEPTGYVKDATPRPITVAPATTAQVLLEVPNTPVPGPALPMTGAEGTLWFTIGGIALLAIAGGGLLLVRRSRAND